VFLRGEIGFAERLYYQGFTRASENAQVITNRFIRRERCPATLCGRYPLSAKAPLNGVFLRGEIGFAERLIIRGSRERANPPLHCSYKLNVTFLTYQKRNKQLHDACFFFGKRDYLNN
jgi:hypothetical protein